MVVVTAAGRIKAVVVVVVTAAGRIKAVVAQRVRAAVVFWAKRDSEKERARER